MVGVDAMKIKHLRPYQEKAVQECWEALKKNDEPVLLMASVGAGKSLMIANILKTMASLGKRALCIVNNAELVRNNCETLVNEGVNASIYCAALGKKYTGESIIFGTPLSILNGINKHEIVGKIRFSLIVVDEAHTINFSNHKSSYMRILRHYKTLNADMRLLGATGTDFRYKGTSITGADSLFKTRVGNISTQYLIEEGYLVRPEFEVDESLIIDFSKVKIKSNGQFDQGQLREVVDKNTRLTELICRQVAHIMKTQNRRGVFFFATTKKHAYEILGHLPHDESAIILGETPQDERTEIMDKARNGIIKYLVNIAIISVGVDIPAFDTIAYLRPTESLVLLVQTMGRVLRLSENTGKINALVLDFAGNIERHSHWDNPILLDAVKQTIDKDKPLVILCPSCITMNTEHARRCVGQTDTKKRCDYYFEFKQCECGAKNDIASRLCHGCNCELIDPNKKLSMSGVIKKTIEVKVLAANYGISGTNERFRVNCAYKCMDKKGNVGCIYEYYSPSSQKAINVFYGQFVKKHCDDSSQWYRHLSNRMKMELMLKEARVPQYLSITVDGEGQIKKKIFL